MGFVRTDILKREFQRIGTSEIDISESLTLLASASLIENEVYDFQVIGQAYRITPAGRYYMRYLAGKMPYLDLMLQDTPIGDESVFTVLKDLLSVAEVESKFKRVRTFLDYLKVEEERELHVVMSTSESLALRRSIIPRMIEEYEEDETYIKHRIEERRKEYHGEPTPYRVESAAVD